MDLTFTESGGADTDATPNVQLNLGTLSDGTNSLTGNQLFTGTTDGAAPAIFASATLDADSDDDLIDDGTEVAFGTDPNDPSDPP